VAEFVDGGKQRQSVLQEVPTLHRRQRYAVVNLKPTIIKHSALVIILLRLTTDRHKASCGLSATAELLVLFPLCIKYSTINNEHAITKL